MIKPIVKDPLLLAVPSEEATAEDAGAARDLLDTLEANGGRCVGMAANMIGVRRRIIAVRDGAVRFVMFNPVITKKAGAFAAEEGCLSLEGTRKTVRYREITVEYQDQAMRKRSGTYTGWIAQIIQHEVDHCSGVLI